MLNMLLAIVMDIYTEVRGSIGDNAETLWSQAYEIWRRHRQKQRGERVSLMYILECIEPAGFAAKGVTDENDEKPLSMQGFVEMVPGLSEKQAARILLASENKRRDGEHESQSISEAIVDIQRIDHRVEQLHEAFQNVTAIGEMSATMQMAISKSVAKSQQRGVEQKDSNGVVPSMPFGADQGVPVWFDKLCEKQASMFLDRCDKLEQQVEGRMQGLASEVAKLASMVNTVSPLQGSAASMCDQPTRVKRTAYAQPPAGRDPRDPRAVPPQGPPPSAAPPP